MPLWKRTRFITHTGGYKVGESFVAAAARQIRPALIIMGYCQSQEVHTSTLVTQIEALQKDVSTLQGQQIDDEDRLMRHIQHEHAQRDAAPEDGDSFLLITYILAVFPFHVLYGRSFKTLCLLNYALMKCHDYDITVFFTKRGVTIMVSKPGFETVGSKDLTCEDWVDQMVNTRTDADLSAAVQNALQTLLPQIRVEIREEFRTSSGPSDSGGNPPPVTIHTWLELFNKQKPCSFEKAIAPVDAENWISHMEKIFDVI
nr:zinc finger, CCHC-type, retrotransposon Gag domain protein [Tanacetum cinerariifolium]